MRSFILTTLRSRWASFLGILVAAAAAAALLIACGTLLESGIRGGVAPERLAGTQIIVSAHQAITEVQGSGDDAEEVHTGVSERLPLASTTIDAIAAVPGVADAVPEISFAAHVLDAGGSTVGAPRSFGHGWASADATSFAIVAGR